MDTEGTTRAGHTPGPWLVDELCTGTWVIASDEGGTFICRFNNCRRELYTNAEANARLIAAAPELLAACRKIRRSDLPDSETPLWDEIQSAIAKAEGGAS